jgi:hypothetical protein
LLTIVLQKRDSDVQWPQLNRNRSKNGKNRKNTGEKSDQKIAKNHKNAPLMGENSNSSPIPVSKNQEFMR